MIFGRLAALFRAWAFARPTEAVAPAAPAMKSLLVTFFMP
jgi:hypothetical protein